MKPTPDMDRTVLTLTVRLDPPLPDDDGATAADLGAELADRLLGASSAMASVDRYAQTVTWTIPTRTPQNGDGADTHLGGPLAELLREAESVLIAYDTALIGRIIVEHIALTTLPELERQAERQHAIRRNIISAEDFRDLLVDDEGHKLSRQRFHVLSQREEFPHPLVRGVWLRSAAEHYAATRRRNAGRPKADA